MLSHDLSMLAIAGSEDEPSVLNTSLYHQSNPMIDVSSSYQVGDVDENGFVCIGIEERKGKVNKDLDTTNYGHVSSDNGSDYSSDEGFGTEAGGDFRARSSQYKKSLDFLAEQGVSVRDIPKDSN